VLSHRFRVDVVAILQHLSSLPHNKKEDQVCGGHTRQQRLQWYCVPGFFQCSSDMVVISSLLYYNNWSRWGKGMGAGVRGLLQGRGHPVYLRLYPAAATRAQSVCTTSQEAST